MPGGYRLGTFPYDRVCKNRSSRGAVTGEVRGLRGNFAHHLSAHVFELVFELDLFRNGNTVLGNSWCAIRLVEHDIAPFGTERHAHRVGENVYAAQHPVARIN